MIANAGEPPYEAAVSLQSDACRMPFHFSNSVDVSGTQGGLADLSAVLRAKA
jgi:hypothetical protein